MPPKSKAKILADVLKADKRLKRPRRGDLAEEISSSFSEEQAARLAALAEKGASVARSYEEYRSLAKDPKLFGFALDISHSLIDGQVVFPGIIVKSIDRLASPPCSPILEDIVSLEVECVKNLKNWSESEETKKIVKKLRKQGIYIEDESKSMEKFASSASKVIRSLEETFSAASALGIESQLLELGKRFQIDGCPAVKKLKNSPKYDPTHIYLKKAVDSIGLIRKKAKGRKPGKAAEAKLWKILGEYPSAWLKEYSDVVASMGHEILKKGGKDEPEKYIWFVGEAERALKLPNLGVHWLHHAAAAAGAGEFKGVHLEISPENLPRYSALSLKSIENYAKINPSEKDADANRLRKFAIAVLSAGRADAANEAIELADIFRLTVNDAHVKVADQKTEPISDYISAVASTFRAVEKLPEEERENARKYIFEWHKMLLESKNGEHALYFAAEAPRVIATGGKEWAKKFGQWYGLARRSINSMEAGRKPKNVLNGVTVPFVHMESGKKEAASKVLARISKEDLKGNERHFMRILEENCADVGTDEILKVWSLAGKMKTYEKMPKRFGASEARQKFDHLACLLKGYSALVTEHRHFAIGIAEKFIEMANKDIFIERPTEFVLDEYREAMSSFFSRVPDLYGAGPEPAIKWVDAVIKAALAEQDKFLARSDVTLPRSDFTKAAMALKRVVRSVMPEELAYDPEKELRLPEIKQVMLDYCQALCRKQLKMGEFSAGYAIIPVTDGETIFLPSRIAFFDNYHDNFKFYKVLASYQCGMIEFGTFECDPEKAAGLLPTKSVAAKLKVSNAKSLEEVLKELPQPELAEQVFYIAEIARIGQMLRKTYPGLAKHMDAANIALIEKRPRIAAKSNAGAALLEASYKYAITGDSSIGAPSKVSEEFSLIKSEIDKLRNTQASVEDSVAAAYRIAEIFPEMKKEEPAELALAKREVEQLRKAATKGKGDAQDKEEAEKEEKAEGEKFRYDEWDSNEGSYRKRHVTVIEIPIEGKGAAFSDKFNAEHAWTAKRVREKFQLIKPKAKQVVRGQFSGEIDYDAAVRAKADINAGIAPSDKIYTKVFHNRRSVVTALLKDISGSSGHFISKESDLRPLDLLRQAAIYYGIGLHELKDRFGIFAYSGKGRDNVWFYKVKDFSEEYGPGIEERISSLRPQANNRDGAGIRHTTSLLLKQPFKTKILLYVTDFSPMDVTPDDNTYGGEYAINDTRMALREAKMKGVFPCVIVVGKKMEERQEELMKGIKHVYVPEPEMLPLTVPQVYMSLTLG